MKIIRRLTDQGISVICTIHQPSTEVFLLFDNLVLLLAGELVYNGPAKSAVSYFKSSGFDHFPGMNPADFISSCLPLSISNINRLM